MAFSLDKLLGYLKGFLSTMTSPMNGYDLEDVKVNSKGDIFSSLFQFKGTSNSENVKDENGGNITDVHGNAISLSILIKAINFQEVFSPILSALNRIDISDKEGSIDSAKHKELQDLLNLLLGDRQAKEGATDNSLEAAQKRGANGTMAGGLLGIDLTKVDNLPTTGLAFGGKFWSWKNIAEQFLKYSMECQAAGKDYGAIENITYENCSRLISEYLVKTGTIANESEVNVDTYKLVLPILMCIKNALCKYYEAAYTKYGMEDVAKNSETLVEEDEYNKAQEDANKEPENVLIFDKDGNSTGEYVDKSTPEGQARLETLLSQGYQIMESKRISTKLRKIQGSIDVLALESNYNPTETLSDLDDIVFQDEFLNTLTEDPQSFNIEVDDDGYDIEQCDNCEVDFCESLAEVFRQGIRFYRNLYILHWMAKGNDMMKLHIMSEEMYGEIIQEIDTLGELLVEKCGQVVPLDFECNYLEIRPYEFQESLDILKANIQMYIDTIDYAYPNQTSDVQSTLDEWLRYWNKQMNYFVKGQEQ